MMTNTLLTDTYIKDRDGRKAYLFILAPRGGKWHSDLKEVEGVDADDVDRRIAEWIEGGGVTVVPEREANRLRGRKTDTEILERTELP